MVILDRSPTPRRTHSFSRRVLPLLLFSLLFAAGFVYGIRLAGQPPAGQPSLHIPLLRRILSETLPLLILLPGAFTGFSPLLSGALLPLYGAVLGCRMSWLFAFISGDDGALSHPSLYFFVLFAFGIWRGITAVFFTVDAAAFSARLRAYPMGRVLRSPALTDLLLSFSLSLLLTSALSLLTGLTVTALP